MTVRITGVPFNQITPQIREALDTALTGTLGLQQSALGKANPKDSGRMASSWFIGHNTPRRDARPEDWGTKATRKTIDGKSVIVSSGSQTYQQEEYTQRITFDGTWYISNNVPYAEYIAYKYSPAAPQAQKDWFTSIANQTGTVFTRQFNKVRP
jgi:hypothetical protein